MKTAAEALIEFLAAQGIDRAPQAFLGLLSGRNFGKQLVKLI